MVVEPGSSQAGTRSSARRTKRLAIVTVVVVVVGALAGALVVRGAEHSGRVGEIARAFEQAEPCGTRFLGLGSRFAVQDWRSRPGKSWEAALASNYGACDPWSPGGHAVMWVEFRTIDDRARASRAIDEDELYPYCVTATEVFFVDLDTQEQLREFCRDVGASEPVGAPLS